MVSGALPCFWSQSLSLIIDKHPTVFRPQCSQTLQVGTVYNTVLSESRGHETLAWKELVKSVLHCLSALSWGLISQPPGDLSLLPCSLPAPLCLHFSSLSLLLQSHCCPYCSSDTPATCPPQGLCHGCSLWLEGFSPESHLANFLNFFKSLLKCHPVNEDYPDQHI